MWNRDDLLARTHLTEVLTELSGPPARSGPGGRWRCPAHDHPDEHPSVSVYRDRRGIERWRCWSGGHGGTAIDAVLAAHPNLAVAAAIEQLAQRTGAAPDEPRPLRPVVNQIERREEAQVSLSPVVERYVEACANILWTRTGQPVRDWLIHDRGLDPTVLRANRVGADPGPVMLRRAAGLPRGGLGAVFPALTPDGSLGYVQTRYLHPEGRGKYDNPTASLGSNPRLAWVTPQHPTQAVMLLVCEGLPDAYTAAGAGFDAVAVLGAGIPDARVADAIASHRGHRSVVLAFDSDAAGRPGSERLQRLLSSRGVRTGTVRIPAEVGDLNAWALTDPDWDRDIHPATAIPAPSNSRSRALRLLPAVGLETPGIA